MSRKNLSRRDALGLIGKTGAAIGAGTCFFLSLKTSPLAGAGNDASAPGRGQVKDPRLTAAPQVAEKVLISGTGAKLTVKISGPPGRHCGVSFATADSRERYKPAANARGYIGENGLATIEVDVKGLPSGKVFLRVVTGKSGAFDEDIAGTEAFVVHISRGAIARYEGLLSRPLENAGSAGIAVASLAAACYSVKR